MKKILCIVLTAWVVVHPTFAGKRKRSELHAYDTFSLTSKEKKSVLAAVRNAVEAEYDMSTKDPIEALKAVPALAQSRGVFVTLRNKGALRGCVGYTASHKPLYELIPDVAQKSTKDHRFKENPITSDELKDITVSVSILTEPHSVSSYNDIEIGTHGIIFSLNNKGALFLPKVPVEQKPKWNLATTLNHLARKAGFREDPESAWRDPGAQFQVFESIDFSESSH